MNQDKFDDKTYLMASEASVSPAETETLPKQTAVLPQDAQIPLIGLILLDRYKIERKLGDGGFGSVFLASDQRLMNKQVVVKVLERNDTEWVLTKFQQEREALSRIEHPGVVGIQDAGELPDGQPFIVMQFVSGITLREAIKSGKMSISRVANITEQTAHALGAAHEKEILHRDLKPENIMLQPLIGEREQVKVIDFGIAKVKKSQVAASSTGLFSAGTLFYMPPESLQGKSYTTASDVYVLAVVVCEMLTGKRPFNPTTESPLLFAGELLEMQKHNPADLIGDIRPDLPDKAREILLKALSFDAEGRFQNVIEFGDEFAKAARNLQISSLHIAKTVLSTPQIPIDSFSPEISVPPPKTKNRKPLLIGGLAVILLSAIAAIGFGIWYVNDSRQATVTKETVVSNAPKNTLQFWLNVQKMRDGKPFQEPFKSSGQEVFENGYKFQLNASSLQKGFLYFFNEGTGDQKDKFWILFPTPKRNDGSAKIKADEAVESGWNVFSGDAGTEKCWLIWTEDENQTLEDVRKNAFESKDGSLSAEQSEKLRKFIAANNSPKTAKKDTQNKQTTIEANEKISVNLIELEHR